MYRETCEIADRVRAALSAELPALPGRPHHLYTLARGSSDHAATVIHRLMAAVGLPSTTMPPSLLRAPLELIDTAILTISQSGASPDLCEAATICRQQGCEVIALVNQVDSPLSAAASVTLAQYAGQERAVAATKSVVCSIVMAERLAEQWGSPTLDLLSLPEQIEQMQSQSLDLLSDLFVGTGPVLVIGRGTGLGVAAEIGLKVQELLGRPAMAYSSAEVLHGPAGMIKNGYPVLAIAVGPQRDAVLATVERLQKLGATVVTLGTAPRTDMFAPVVVLAHVYLALENAARRLGRSPDKPDNLTKVTLTR